MPSIFAQAFAVGQSSIYEAVGEDALYTDGDGFSASCTVIVNKNLAQYGDTLTVQGATAVISVRVSELPDRPRRDDTFRVGCVDYVVDDILSSNDYEHEVIVL